LFMALDHTISVEIASFISLFTVARQGDGFQYKPGI
jgi:hypothetical protein